MKVKDILGFSIGPVGSAALSLLILPIITWFFSPSDVGRISLLSTIVSFSTLFFTLGLDQSYVRSYHETEDRNALLKECFLPGAFVLCSVLFFAFVFDYRLISSLIFDVESTLYSLGVILCIVLSFFSRFLALNLRMKEKGFQYSLSQLLPKLGVLIVVLIYIYLNEIYEFSGLIIANIISFTLTFATLVYLTQKSIRRSLPSVIDIDRLKNLIKFGFPLVFSSVAFWGLTSVDKVFIKVFSTLDELGLYSVSVSFAGAAIVLQKIFSTIWAPTVYKWCSEGRNLEKIPRIQEMITLIILVFFCLTGVFSWVIDYILPSDYIDVKYIVLSCMGFPLLYTLSETTMIGIGVTKKSMFALIASLIALAVNVIGNYFMIPLYGAAGAAVSTSISFFVFFILRTEFSCLIWKRLPRMKMYILVLISVSYSIFIALFGSNYKIEIISLSWFFYLIIILFLYGTVVRELMS
ncbi:oligosaccharide flippase family protein, partial [Vibrio sp. S/42/10]|uniref:lipopolysaccharide biosynthesis protein n=1 Tax=Vibrio sp. S/42/10 TaxID=2914757 RepID=UPI002468965E